MTKWFAASDIHGFYSIYMQELLRQGFDVDNPDHKLIICGDLLDRGDETVALFDFVKRMLDRDRLIYVRGNHEDLLFDCVKEIKAGRTPSSHHFHNGTIKTICQFCEQNEWIIYDPTWQKRICNVMQPVVNFIASHTVDYTEIGDYIFVHGWIPTRSNAVDFREANEDDWKRARWENGMAMWNNPRNRIDGKTIVCGHYHCSWGWSHLRQERKEFPQKNRIDWAKSFEPFIDNGICAIDACTAATGLCNVMVFDEE